MLLAQFCEIYRFVSCVLARSCLKRKRVYCLRQASRLSSSAWARGPDSHPRESAKAAELSLTNTWGDLLTSANLSRRSSMRPLHPLPNLSDLIPTWYGAAAALVSEPLPCDHCSWCSCGGMTDLPNGRIPGRWSWQGCSGHPRAPSQGAAGNRSRKGTSSQG